MRYFNLEEAKAKEPICTRSGRPARIICFDAKDEERPIIALITDDDGTEMTKWYHIDGRFLRDDIDESDLMMLNGKFQPRKGDFIVFGDEEQCIGIFKEYKDGVNHVDYATCRLGLPNVVYDGENWDKSNIRLAKKDEKNILLNMMHYDGKDWDEKGMNIKDYIWIPEEGEECYIPVYDNSINEFTPLKIQWDCSEENLKLIRRGWVLKKRNESQILCEILSIEIEKINYYKLSE